MLDVTLIPRAQEIVAQFGVNEETVSAMRKEWPNYRFTFCSDDDVPPRLDPIASGEGYAFYMIAGGDHCLALTKEPAAAIGLVLAYVEPDE